MIALGNDSRRSENGDLADRLATAAGVTPSLAAPPHSKRGGGSCREALVAPSLALSLRSERWTKLANRSGQNCSWGGKQPRGEGVGGARPGRGRSHVAGRTLEGGQRRLVKCAW